ncbi:MAG TPA: MerR family transcriptional regulator [Caulobacter sp.]|nr:MerR family transcriptional regulator [Caulobacter sp.]
MPADSAARPLARVLPLREREVSISEVVALTGLTHRAIRLYEQRGLVRSIRYFRGIRHYDRDTLERLRFIGEVRRAGLSIDRIRELLTVGDVEGLGERLARTQDAYRDRLDELEAERRGIEASAHALGFTLQPQRARRMAR